MKRGPLQVAAGLVLVLAVRSAHERRRAVPALEPGPPRLRADRRYRAPCAWRWAASLLNAIAHPAAPGESDGIPVWVSTIFVRPPRSWSSTVTSVVAGCPGGMPRSEGDSTLPLSSDMDSV